MAKHTIAYKETGNAQGGGFPTFFSFEPELMGSLDNDFFSVKDGQLYMHHDEENLIRVNYYGTQYYSKIITVLNENPSDDKIWKTLNIEGTDAWDAFVKTLYTETSINREEFNKKESRFFAYIRKNTSLEENNGTLRQGVGIIQSQAAGVISFNSLPDEISIGDTLYQADANDIIGTITAIDRANGTITVGTVVNTPQVGLFSYSQKEARIEGSEIRGYYLEVELTYNETGGVELFAINSNAVKSYV